MACCQLQSGSYALRTEWDFEFLGSATDARGMNIQTNYWEEGKSSHEVIVPYWFDPAEDFHNYTIDWSPDRTRYCSRLPIGILVPHGNICCDTPHCNWQCESVTKMLLTSCVARCFCPRS